MSNGKVFYSFEDYCLDNDVDLLQYWDYELNKLSPKNVAKSSNKKYYFKCPRGLHESRKITVNSVTKAYSEGRTYCLCLKCNSIGQYIIDNYGEDYLNQIWSDKNECSYYDISQRSAKTIWLRCLCNENHPDYELQASNFINSHNCPYCSGKQVCESNSLAVVLPQSLEVWSDKNEKTPYDYTKGSSEIVWWKCENGIHEDYQRMISRTVSYEFRCPVCGRENQKIYYGSENPRWKGGVSSENQKARSTPEYEKWRKAVFEKDGYVCQCCGEGEKKEAHHLLDFANHPDHRLDVENGITLCPNCHCSCIEGSFHNIYGTHGTTPEQLEEYINIRRQELGINIAFTLEQYRSGIRIQDQYDPFNT